MDDVRTDDPSSRHPRLDDPTRCPACSASLGSSWCAVCGLRLDGPLAQELFDASVQAEHWLGERRRLVTALRLQPVPSPPSSQSPVQAHHEAAPSPATPSPASPSAATPPASLLVPEPHRVRTMGERHGVGVQAVLVGLGALLLAVAAVVFLAFSWDVLGLTGRALVVATSTVAVLGIAAWARRTGLTATAEAVAAVGVVLVLLDAGAVHATGLFEADEIPGLSFAAGAAAVVTVLLAAFGRLVRLRAATVAAAVLAPSAPALAGAAAADAGSGTVAFVLGLAGALVVCLVRGTSALAGLGAERRVLAAAAVAATGIAVPGIALVAVADGAWLAALSAAALALATAAQQSNRQRSNPWGVTAGAFLGSAAFLVTVALDPGTWLLALAPTVVGALAVALAVAARGVAGSGAAAKGAAGVGAVTLLPAAALLGALVVGAPMLAAAAPWSASPGTALAQALAASGDAGDELLDSTAVLACVTALALAAVLCVAGRRATGAARVGAPAPWLAAVAAAGVPWWQPQAPVVLVVVVGIVLAVSAGLAAVTVLEQQRAAALAVAVVAGTSAVLLAWTVRELSVPATLVGVAGLLVARSTTRTWRAPLAAAATTATLVAVGAAARWAGAGLSDAVVVAGLGGAAAIVAVALVPVREGVADRQGRRAVMLPGLLASGAGVLAAGGPVLGDVTPVVAQVALLVAVAALALARVAPQDTSPSLTGALSEGAAGLSRTERSFAAGAAPLVALAAALSAATTWGGPRAGLVAALVTATSCCVATAIARRGDAGTDARRAALEIGTCATAAITLTLILHGTGPGRAVLPLAVLAVAALVVATAADRRPAGWVALGLGAAAWWLRLDAGSVGVVEAYTLPVAGVLLAVAVRGSLRGRPDAGTAPTALAGAALAVVPSTLAGVVGAPWRLAAVVLVAVAALAACRFAGRAGAWRSWVPVLAGVAAVVAVAGAWPRALVAAEPSGLTATAGIDVEGWALAAAGLLIAAAMTAAAAGAASARLTAHAPAVGLVVLALPSLVATSGDSAGASGSLARVVGVIAVSGAAVLVRALWGPGTLADGRGVFGAVGRGSLGAVGRGTAVVAGLWGLTVDVAGPAEAVTVPLGALLVADGWLRMRDEPASPSLVLAPGLVVLLVPSLLLAAGTDEAWRLVGLAALATAVVVVGASRQWAAPLLVGGSTLVVHALVQLAPTFVVAYEAVPRWVSLALAGALLLGVGARYESRLADLRSLRNRLTSLR